jgi:multimeric flavodoxin WrbA
MKVIGFSGSPRKAGNTDILVGQVLETVYKRGAEIEFLRIADLRISPCDACWTCAQIGRCHIEDDMQELYTKLLKSDGIVVGSPVHMGYGVSGQTQVFLDRTFALWHQKRLKNKIGGAVVVSNRRGGMSCARIINSLFHNHEIIIAGYASGYGNAPGDVRKDERAGKEATILGERLCDLIEIVKK